MILNMVNHDVDQYFTMDDHGQIELIMVNQELTMVDYGLRECRVIYTTGFEHG